MTSQYIKATQLWVNTMVVAENLCPFAKKELVKNKVHFQISNAHTEEALLHDLGVELERLTNSPTIETTLLIHPFVLTEFSKYNQFLDVSDKLLTILNLDGVFQIASFHPDYCFEGYESDDETNYSNRSPYPMLHILREESIERAVKNYPNPQDIPDNNIEKLKQLGLIECQKRLSKCLNGS